MFVNPLSKNNEDVKAFVRFVIVHVEDTSKIKGKK